MAAAAAAAVEVEGEEEGDGGGIARTMLLPHPHSSFRSTAVGRSGVRLAFRSAVWRVGWSNSSLFSPLSDPYEREREDADLSVLVLLLPGWWAPGRKSARIVNIAAHQFMAHCEISAWQVYFLKGSRPTSSLGHSPVVYCMLCSSCDVQFSTHQIG